MKKIICGLLSFVLLACICSVSAETDGYYSRFTSKDGAVDYIMAIGAFPEPSPMPIVTVTPHYLTAEDAKRVAETLFPGGEFYENRGLWSDRVCCKEEIRQKLERWEPYTDAERLSELMVRDQVSTAEVERYIEEFRQKLETAPEEPGEKCRWQMRNELEDFQGILPTEELAGEDLSEYKYYVAAKLLYHGLPYNFSAATCHSEDFRMNTLSCYLYTTDSPLGIDRDIFWRELCQGEAPTEEQVVAVKAMAEAMLAAFELGQWRIIECELLTDPLRQQHYIQISAVPELDGVAVLPRSQTPVFRELQPSVYGNYPSDACFVFSPSGELMRFEMETPLEILRVEEQSAPLLGQQEWMLCVQQALAEMGAERYDMGYAAMPRDPEAVDILVTVTQMECVLTREAVDEQNDLYRYIPAVKIMGDVIKTDRADGTVLCCNEEPWQLLMLSALDRRPIY